MVTVGGGRGLDNAEASCVREVRLRRLAVVLDRADAAAERDPDDDRHLQLALAAEVDLRDLADDLVVGGKDEIGELDLDHRALPIERSAYPNANHASLGQGRVDDALRSVFLAQALGGLEHAAARPDVVADQQDGFVAGHFFVERLAEAIDVLGDAELGDPVLPGGFQVAVHVLGGEELLGGGAGVVGAQMHVVVRKHAGVR